MKHIAILAALGTLAFAAPASAQAFDAAQKEEMGGIIRDYLMENPKVIMDAVERYRANQEEIEAKAMEDSILSKSDALFNNPKSPVVGNPKGDVTIVEFLDYNCGYCKIAFRDIETLLKEDKNLRVVFKEIPILSESSHMASRYALAAHKQGKYWDFHMALMTATGGIDENYVENVAKGLKLDMKKLKADAESAEVRETLEANLTLAREIGFSGTPSFVVGTRPLRGHYGIEALRKFIADTREQAKGE